MGLTLSVFKTAHQECSNGGFSSYCDQVVAVNIDGPSEPDENRPPVLLLPGNVAGTAKVVCASGTEEKDWTPLSLPGEVGPMMGGTYVATSDSRFVEKVEEITGARFYGAVAFHDRYD